jgi:Zn-dependent peptidase ImmA (M78 family)
LSEIEKVANEALTKAEINAPKIMADNIAEFTYELEFEWRNLNQCSEGKVLAAINFKNGIIYLNESFERELKNCPGRMNFSIAHELGHWLLHKNSAQVRLPMFEEEALICRGLNNKTDDRERQANLFATYLLMPEKFIVECMKDFSSPLSECDLKTLAEIFGVSKQAMKIRLTDELKILYVAEGMYYKSKFEALEAGGQQKLF